MDAPLAQARAYGAVMGTGVVRFAAGVSGASQKCGAVGVGVCVVCAGVGVSMGVGICARRGVSVGVGIGMHVIVAPGGCAGVGAGSGVGTGDWVCVCVCVGASAAAGVGVGAGVGEVGVCAGVYMGVATVWSVGVCVAVGAGVAMVVCAVAGVPVAGGLGSGRSPTLAVCTFTTPITLLVTASLSWLLLFCPTAASLHPPRAMLTIRCTRSEASAMFLLGHMSHKQGMLQMGLGWERAAVTVSRTSVQSTCSLSYGSSPPSLIHLTYWRV